MYKLRTLKKTRTLIIITSFMLLGHLTGFAQQIAGSAIIKGTVKTKDGKPAEFVTVAIKGGKSAQVDAKGNYTIKDIKGGHIPL